MSADTSDLKALIKENLGDQTISNQELFNMDVTQVPTMEDYLDKMGVLPKQKDEDNCCKKCEITAPSWEVVKDFD